MDQFRGFGKRGDGTSRGERSRRDRRGTSEMGGASAGSSCAETGRESDVRRIARISRYTLRKVATSGCVCVCGRNSTNVGRKIFKEQTARRIRRMEVGILAFRQ